MPKTTIKRNTARRTRKSTLSGSYKKRNRRAAGPGKKKSSTGIIANSFFALTLKPKYSMQVLSIMDSPVLDLFDDYKKMYQDLLIIIQRCLKLKPLVGEITTYNPLKNGFDLGESFRMVMGFFKQHILPDGWDYNVEKEQNGNFHIAMYRHCAFDTMWNCFEIKPVVLALAKKNLRLHNMFIRVMKTFCHNSDISTWDQHGLGYVDYESLEENYLNYEFDTEEEELKKKFEVDQTIECYKKGDAFKYYQLLKNQKPVAVKELRRQLKEFPANIKLVKWMKQACDFLELGGSVIQFIYPELYEDDGCDGLRFDQQMNIIWDCGDDVSTEHEGYLDSEANGNGIADPIYHVRLRNDIKTLDLEAFNKAIEWPKKLTELFFSYNDAIKIYEPKNRTINE